MHEHALPVAPLWPALVNLNAHRVLLDVGGGSGTHSVAAVESAPGLSAVILEVHSMARCAERAVAERGLKERIRVVAGDMFHGDWPEADLHLLADVLHDWRPETARGLVRKSFAALPPGGRLALLEMPLAEGDGPLPEVLASSLAMLLTVGGQQYTLAELKGFLSGAGFTRLEAHSVDGLWSLVTGRKP
ncbi:MAG: hypothetical protein JNK60_05065 [Acidobacteria bacterium]|nr:hypothetical protein [Acidobacteriota bacterium]